MVLPSPNLDDRDFDQLLRQAKERFTQFSQSTVEWTDLTPSDPGIILLELFAHLTEIMIYRLNRLPQKVYIEFLRLLGVHLQPPAAASVNLEFTRPKATDQALVIPAGTKVTLSRTGGSGNPPVFVTLEAATIPASAMKTQVTAYHCDVIDFDSEKALVGTGNGKPGQSFSVTQPPIVAPMADKLELRVAVEALLQELEERATAVQVQGKPYLIWREVENFANVGLDDPVYMVDRVSGMIYFAPALRSERKPSELDDTPLPMAKAPAEGRQVRVAYRYGGGADGNVAPGTLKTIKNFTGVEVTNPAAASGGRAVETPDNALLRGPQQFRSLQRAVTATDFEIVAQNSSSSVKRARAYTKAELWTYAERGTVEVLLVPTLPLAEDEPITLEKTQTYQNQHPEILTQVKTGIDSRRSLGIICVVDWVRYKKVSVSLRVSVYREENPDAVQKRLVNRFYQTINPYSRQFGQALSISDIFDIALKEPGVRSAEDLRLIVDEAPEKATYSIVRDNFQPQTWYAGSASTLFRSLNDGSGWEAVQHFPAEEEVRIILVSPSLPGLLAAVTRLTTGTGSGVVISHDCGETWEMPGWSIGYPVEDITWIMRDNLPVLLLATQKGLFELDPRPGHNPLQLLVDRNAPQDRGYYSVVAHTDARGITNVAVVAEDDGGVYLSSEGGTTNSFHSAEVPSATIPTLKGKNIRVLAVQVQDSRAFVWAGAAAEGDVPGDGCWRWELRGTEYPPEGWTAYQAGWEGGSCLGLAFQDSKVFAASRRAGVLRLDSASNAPTWQPNDPVRSGLPIEQVSIPGGQRAEFQRVETVAVAPATGGLILSGGAEGVFLCQNGGETYSRASNKESRDTVTLPENWLFVSGAHDIQVNAQ